MWSGISVFATHRQASRKAHDFPFLGSYIATIEIEDGGPIRYARTGPRSPGHHTLWGEPAQILQRVRATVTVRETDDSE